MLIIDPQNDFCDLPPSYLLPELDDKDQLYPSLPVPGAHEDMLRVANLINQSDLGISGINVTLDSHHRIDIAHPNFWVDKNQGRPEPFTIISAADVRAGSYLPRLLKEKHRVLNYLDQLESTDRHQLMVWPVHCEIGSWGQNIHFDVRNAYNLWEDRSLRTVKKIFKGSNPWTEHYSAVKAEVPDEQDINTQLNLELLGSLSKADRIYIAGEAGSHCVKATTEHIVDYFNPENVLSKLVLIDNCISPVGGFEIQQKEFFNKMKRCGVTILTAEKVLTELQANN